MDDWRIGVDVGGTFMDFYAVEVATGRTASLKVLTTPDNPGAELRHGLDLLAQRAGVPATAINRFVHGTTVGINTVIQRTGAKLALLTNAGFEDVIELARLRMPDMYSLFCHRAEPLIPRDMVFGLPLRMRADGRRTEEAALEGAVAQAIDSAIAGGAEGVVIALLHAWRDASQEALVKAMVAAHAPQLFCFTSAEVWPVIREYERTSTAILNAYVHPKVAGYLTALEGRLQDQGVPTHALLTRSNGGLMTAQAGRRDCVSMLLSGTASGVTGASWLARQAGESKVLTLDIGGTSADFALILDGEVQFGTEQLVGEFPLHIPSVAVSSIGIGGGSIAAADAQGVLRVGPESAGSNPGPACYGRGGTKPTVTDAMVVCGWLGHSGMAYGQLTMDRTKAVDAITPLADDMNRTVEETAQAIIDIAVSELFVEVEKLASRAGLDLRDFALMPFGGGGPMLGAFLARELGMARVIAPRRPGVVSALGGLVSDMRGDFIRTEMRMLDGAYLADLREGFATLEAEGRAWLAAQGYTGETDMRLSAEMRYAGQSFEIEVPLTRDWLHSTDAIAEAFHRTHLAIYDFEDRAGKVEVVNLRLSALGVGSPPQRSDPPSGDAAPPRSIRVYTGDWREVSLFERDGLAPGAALAGPAVVAQEDTTLVIPDGTSATVDEHLNIVLTIGATA
ncbi:MAG: hydantoinase/oxoprolinase family protein [Pseudomonadota bacterium]